MVYLLIPYIFVAKNKIGLVYSILVGHSNHVVKLKEGMKISFKDHQFSTMLCFLGVLTFSAEYSKIPKNKLEFSFDLQNKFTVSLDRLTYEDENLLELLFGAARHGANFVTQSNINFENYRDKTIKITQEDNRKIIETSEGIRFYLDSIHPGNTIIETFVQKTHHINSHDDWKDKVVIDVGAEMGDTPLYYANLGARVYAVEPIKEHFDAMILNMSLNPKIAHRITPINAAVGKDEDLTFFQDIRGVVGDTSFMINTHGENTKSTIVKGYSLETLLNEYNIDHVDLLKMDCKGCEFFITEGVLEKTDRVKIEFNASNSPLKLEDLLFKLKKLGFEYMLYKTNPLKRTSNRHDSHVFGTKLKHN